MSDIRLLIVDDDPEIASALARGLGMHGYSTVTANRADLALQQLRAEPFSCAIIDVMLGADSGIDLVRTARAEGISLPILMLSALSDVEDRAAGLAAGADDYVVKPFSFEELVARLKVQEIRVRAAQPTPSKLDRAKRVLHRGGDRLTLTEREAGLLDYLSAHAPDPVSRGAIFDALWASEGSSNENVVDVYVGYLRKKLKDGDFGFEIVTIRHQGFCLQGLTPQRV